MKRWLSTVVVASLASGMAHGADEHNRFALKGAGFVACGVFLEERSKKSAAYYMAAGWIDGYLSAHNQYNSDTYDLTSFESVELLLNVVGRHCQQNPQHKLHGVLSSIVQQMHPHRISRESERLEITDDGRSTTLYRETIRRMQQRLSEMGLYKDPVDGRYTDATRAALIAFQSHIEFEMTGFPDQATLWRLFRS